MSLWVQRRVCLNLGGGQSPRDLVSKAMIPEGLLKAIWASVSLSICSWLQVVS